MPVLLRGSAQDVRRIEAYVPPEIATTRKLREIFPTLRERGNKIGTDVEVIGVAASDFNAEDAAARKAQAAAVVGRGMELRLVP